MPILFLLIFHNFVTRLLQINTIILSITQTFKFMLIEQRAFPKVGLESSGNIYSGSIGNGDYSFQRNLWNWSVERDALGTQGCNPIQKTTSIRIFGNKKRKISPTSSQCIAYKSENRRGLSRAPLLPQKPNSRGFAVCCNIFFGPEISKCSGDAAAYINSPHLSPE